MIDNVDLERLLQEALAQCEKLRVENTQLKDRLGKSADSFTAEPGPNSSALDKNPSGITNQSSSEAKIELFRALFRGREELYALRWESRNGRSGYSPACGNDMALVPEQKPKCR